MKTEDNKLIAEFLGSNQVKEGEGFDLYSNMNFNFLFEDVKGDDPDAKHFYLAEELKFHTSWDWIMPAVDKINIVVGDNMNALQDDIHNAMARVDKSATHHSIVEFINSLSKS
jgi:hypothetical protein